MVGAAKLEKVDGEGYLFWCPGCGHSHMFYTERESSPKWEFNGDMVAPTFKPSLLNTSHREPERPNHICHLYLTDGKLVFLSDCSHKLAGKTVPLEPRP